jgi:putative methionine-R-sulfoxide reductase with GAF domain
MYGSAQPEEKSGAAEDVAPGVDRPADDGVSERSNGNQTLAENELDSALQLLVERAQYITGATGAALAVPQGEEMVCRASAGSSAPAVGARLQVRSGLTGESIARRQLLRCDNAEADPRVNLEACRALGIASIVVLPLLRRDGAVRGLFELFSDHPYAFEERDLIALERMAELTLTALDLAEQRQTSAPAATPAPAATRGTEKAVDTPAVGGLLTVPVKNAAVPVVPPILPPPSKSEIPDQGPVEPKPVAQVVPAADPPVISLVSGPTAAGVDSEPSTPASIPAAMLRVQKCGSCGFPVSEGRTLCLDCEKKESSIKEYEKKQRKAEQAVLEQKAAQPETKENGEGPGASPSSSPVSSTTDAPTASAVSNSEEFVPAFLANAVPVKELWMANHVNLLAIVVLILGILVAVVVFR